MDKIVANAEESGYRLLERADFRSAEHRVGCLLYTSNDGSA